jgi:hypothetical protein
MRSPRTASRTETVRVPPETGGFDSLLAHGDRAYRIAA